MILHGAYERMRGDDHEVQAVEDVRKQNEHGVKGPRPDAEALALVTGTPPVLVEPQDRTLRARVCGAPHDQPSRPEQNIGSPTGDAG